MLGIEIMTRDIAVVVTLFIWGIGIQYYSDIHTYTHIHMYTCTHTNARRHACEHSRTRIRTYTLEHTYAYTHTCMGI